MPNSAAPSDLKYTDTHEWVRTEDDKVTVGTTVYGVEKLGDMVYVQLPDVGRSLSQGESFGALESVITTMNLKSPVSGKVLQVNNDLSSSPDLVNLDPYDAWIMKVELSDASEVDKLMDSEAYLKFCEEEDAKL